MVPLGDVIPTRTFPAVVSMLIPAHLALFAAEPPVAVLATMLALWLFGRTVEDRLGHGRFLLFYLLCAALAAYAANTAIAAAAAAATGGMAGVTAAYFSLYPRSKIVLLVPIPLAWRMVEAPAITGAAVWLTLQGVGRVPPIASLALGAIGGALLIWIVRRPERLRVEWWNDTSR